MDFSMEMQFHFRGCGEETAQHCKRILIFFQLCEENPVELKENKQYGRRQDEETRAFM